MSLKSTFPMSSPVYRQGILAASLSSTEKSTVPPAALASFAARARSMSPSNPYTPSPDTPSTRNTFPRLRRADPTPSPRSCSSFSSRSCTYAASTAACGVVSVCKFNPWASSTLDQPAVSPSDRESTSTYDAAASQCSKSFTIAPRVTSSISWSCRRSSGMSVSGDGWRRSSRYDEEALKLSRLEASNLQGCAGFSLASRRASTVVRWRA